MAIEMVRIPSETPNISNTDDFVGLRYAYGNQSGYVIGKGFGCSYNINGSTFIIHAGRLVLQGVECDIDANGVEITVDNVATKRYYSIYLQINLALNEVKILATYDTATYPVINRGDDLTQSQTGTARMELYRFDAINGEISNVNKTVKQIEYTENVIVKKAKNLVGIDYDLRQYLELVSYTEFSHGETKVFYFQKPIQINQGDSIVIRYSKNGIEFKEIICIVKSIETPNYYTIYDSNFYIEDEGVENTIFHQYYEYNISVSFSGTSINVCCNITCLVNDLKLEGGTIILGIYKLVEGRIEE